MTPKKRKPSKPVSLSKIHAAGLKAQQRAAKGKAGADAEQMTLRRMVKLHLADMKRTVEHSDVLIRNAISLLQQPSQHVTVSRVLVGVGAGTVEPGETRTFRTFVTIPIVCDSLQPRILDEPKDPLKIVPSSQGLVIESYGSQLLVESFRIGDTELVHDGIAFESLDANMCTGLVLFPEIETSITLRSTHNEPVKVALDIKGHIESMPETIRRQARLIEQLQAKLHAEKLLRETQAPEVFAGGINGGTEPPPPLPAELSDGELAEVKRSVAPLADRPLVIAGQE